MITMEKVMDYNATGPFPGTLAAAARDEKVRAA